MPGGEFVFGRDGYLTLRDLSGALAYRLFAAASSGTGDAQEDAGERTGGVFSWPTHAAQFRVALDQLRFDQAIIAIMPEAADFQIAMHCDDFSKEIAGHRIFFATGADWAQELTAVFRRHPGLAPPSHFVRLATLAESKCDAMMRTAQKVFATVANERAEQIKAVWRDRAT